MMRQITDPRAPFASIDDAIAAGHEHLRQQPGASPVGMIAEEQPGGYFVRIAWTTPVARGGRGGRKRYQHHAAEVGKVEGPWLHPLNDTTLSGRPWFFCAELGLADAEDANGEWEPDGTAQRRLVAAHQRRAGGGR